MEQFLWLPIFPHHSLANSVTTSVWVGVWVSCFMNLRFGWVLSGLVVPGYIVPLIILKPWAAVVIAIEALLSYLIVWIWSEYLPRFGIGSGLFGRDRFFSIFLVSVIVRILLETFVLPPVGEYLANTWIPNFDYRNSLHSFGLVVVALLANQIWKPGLRRGLVQSSVTIIITYVLVRYVLMEFTNYSIGNLNYLYEDIAKSMLASPKSYIILLTTAFIASRMNLDYGWEFGGILIPSLLALQWYQPEKIFWSFLESFVIMGMASLLLRLPVFRNADIQGGRKILFFFNVGFVYHFVIGYFIQTYFPEYKATDYFGFGYLLTTLLAIRMYEKDITARVTRATLQTSLVAVLVATVIGFGLKWIPNIFNLRALSSLEIQIEDKKPSNISLIDEIRKQKVAIFRTLIPGSYVTPLPNEMDIFSQAMDYLSSYLRTGDQSELRNSEKLLWLTNYKVDRLQGGYLFISERTPQRGWGTYVINPGAASDLLVEVPAPAEEWGIVEAGASLYTSMGARALAIAGSAQRSLTHGYSDVTANQSTILALFHKAMGSRGVLQVRGYTAEATRSQPVKEQNGSHSLRVPIESTLWVKHSLPPGIDLAMLKDLIGPFRIEWRSSPYVNILRDRTSSGFVELVLDRKDVLSLISKSGISAQTVHSEIRDQSIVGYLQDWILQQKDQFPQLGSNLYVRPELKDLVYFDQEVLTPFLMNCYQSYTDKGWSSEGIEQLQALSYFAGAVGYEFIRYRDRNTGEDYVILSERKDSSKKKYWGTYVFRLGHSNNYLIQVPRPITELNVFEYGVSLFEQLRARLLLIGGSHPMANIDGSSDIIHIQNKENLFNLVNQVVLRQSVDESMLVIQCRAFGYKPDMPPLEFDAILSLKSGVTKREMMDPLMIPLLNILDRDWRAIGFADGTPSVVGYEVGGIIQSLYVDQSKNKEFVVLWLSPLSRSHFLQQTENRVQEQEFNALRIPTIQADLFLTLLETKPCDSIGPIPTDLTNSVNDYMETEDVVSLDRILKKHPEYRYTRLIDLGSKQSFLIIHSQKGCLAAAANLSPRNSKTTVRVNHETMNRDEILEFVNSRTAWLTLK